VRASVSRSSISTPDLRASVVLPMARRAFLSLIKHSLTNEIVTSRLKTLVARSHRLSRFLLMTERRSTAADRASLAPVIPTVDSSPQY
jgi:hypothetical protein